MSNRFLALARVVLSGLRVERFRSMLVGGSVALGIASMTVVLALGRGARGELEADGSGAAVVTVAAGQIRALPGRGGGWYQSTRLDEADADALDAAIEGVRRVSPMIEGTRRVELRGRSTATSIRGVEPGYLKLRGFAVARGRPLDSLDASASSRVAVAGARLGDFLDRGGLVGETVLIGGVPFEVVGELAPKGLGSDGSSEDDQILIPIETAAHRLFNRDYFTAVLIAADDAARSDEIRQAARGLLRERHGLQPGVADDFEVLLPLRAGEIGRAQSSFMRRLARLVSIAALSFAGLGVLVVTYLNVSDRTSEVGLRLAIGARRRDIAAMFLVEAAALTSLGGLAGVAIAAVSIAVARLLTGWALELDLLAIGLPALLSAVIGIAFGALPAIRASRLMPVTALGSE